MRPMVLENWRKTPMNRSEDANPSDRWRDDVRQASNIGMLQCRALYVTRVTTTTTTTATMASNREAEVDEEISMNGKRRQGPLKRIDLFN